MGHKFKVGDKVKVHYLTGSRIGYIQERKSELRYDIRYDEGCIGHDIEENRIVKYNGNQDMEIKVGDKVRVSKDAPKLYTRYATMVCGVNNVEDGIAVISPTDKPMVKCVIPTKYLIKVEDEAKEPKFKVGDKVRKKKWDKDTTISYVKWHDTWQTYVYRFAEQEYGFNCHKEEDITLVSRRAKEPKFKTGDCVKISFEWNDLPIGEKLVIKRLETIDCHNAYMYSIEGYGGCVIESMLHPYTEPTTPTIKVGDVIDTPKGKGAVRISYGDYWVVQLDNGEWYIHMETNMPYASYTEPTEPTEAEKKPNIGSIKIPVEVDLTDSYWDTYTADLAHDIAVKIVNKNMDNDPEEVAEYAASVAKAVVENLKKK